MMAGMAMLTMVTSSRAMNMPNETAMRIHHLRGSPWSSAGVPAGGPAAAMEVGSLTVLPFMVLELPCA